MGAGNGYGTTNLEQPCTTNGIYLSVVYYTLVLHGLSQFVIPVAVCDLAPIKYRYLYIININLVIQSGS